MSGWAKPKLDRDQAMLFSPTLDAMLSEDHPVRLFEEMLRTLYDWSAWESQYVLVSGQPPIHPRVLAGAILYGMSRRLRSSRQLEDACINRMDFLWLTEGRQIDHSTFAGFRTKFEEELKGLFKGLCRGAMKLGMILLSQTGLDGTKIRANSSRHGTAGEETLRKRLAEMDGEVERLMRSWSSADRAEDGLFGGEGTPNRLPRELADWKRRQKRLQEALEAAGRKSAGSSEGDGEACGSGREEPESAGQEAGEPKDAKAAGQGKGKGKKSKKVRVPVADPQSTVQPNKEGGWSPNYVPQALVDGAEGLIVGTEVLSEPDEGSVTLGLVDAASETLGKKPGQLLADGAYGSGANLSGLDTRGVEALIPVSRAAAATEPGQNPAERSDPRDPVAEEDWGRLPRNRRSKKLDRTAFVYDGAGDCYWCPLGHRLGFVGTQDKGRGGGEYRLYRCGACGGCGLSGQCVGSRTGYRTVFRDEYEPLREAAEGRLSSEAGRAAYRRRSWIAETPFAVIKGLWGIRQFLLRGLKKVKTEWLWVCTAYNLNKMVGKVARLRAASAGKA